MEYSKEYNRNLIEKFPFLIPKNVFSGKLPEDYDYDYTWLDDMPDGWRAAFGNQMCQEIADSLLSRGVPQENLHILQIKEKFGGLRFYCEGGTKEIYDTIIPKYEAESYCTCISCGKPAKYITTGWISPFCEDCIKEIRDGYIPIEEYYEMDTTEVI